MAFQGRRLHPSTALEGYRTSLKRRLAKFFTNSEAFEQYKQLLAQPQKRAVPSDSLAGIIDAFLE